MKKTIKILILGTSFVLCTSNSWADVYGLYFCKASTSWLKEADPAADIPANRWACYECNDRGKPIHFLVRQTAYTSNGAPAFNNSRACSAALDTKIGRKASKRVPASKPKPTSPSPTPHTPTPTPTPTSTPIPTTTPTPNPTSTPTPTPGPETVRVIPIEDFCAEYPNRCEEMKKKTLDGGYVRMNERNRILGYATGQDGVQNIGTDEEPVYQVAKNTVKDYKQDIGSPDPDAEKHNNLINKYSDRQERFNGSKEEQSGYTIRSTAKKLDKELKDDPNFDKSQFKKDIKEKGYYKLESSDGNTSYLNSKGEVVSVGKNFDKKISEIQEKNKELKERIKSSEELNKDLIQIPEPDQMGSFSQDGRSQTNKSEQDIATLKQEINNNEAEISKLQKEKESEKIAESTAKEKTKSRAEKNADRKERNQARRDAKYAVKAEQMIEKVDDQTSYGGKYGGFNKETSAAANQAVNFGLQLSNQIAATKTQQQGNSTLQDLNKNNAGLNERMKAEADLLEKAGWDLKTMRDVTIGASAAQVGLATAHQLSKIRVNRTRAAADGAAASKAEAECAHLKVGQAASIATNDNYEMCVTKAKRNYLKIADQNKTAENKAQNQAVINNMIEATKTTTAALAREAERKAAFERAKSARDFANQFNQSPGFSIDQPQGGVEEQDPVNQAESAAVVSTPTLDESPLDDPLLDPGLAGQNVMGGPTPDAQVLGGNAGPSGAGGGGPGGAGATSAAKDDGGKEDAKNSKDSGGGTYAAQGGSGGGRFGRSGGTYIAGGADPDFAAMLKGLLPGGEKEETADGKMSNDQNRDPASDGAAVLGKNTNIFDAISKGYQKKSTEGAIRYQ